MKIGYYPGCSLEGSSREYNESLQAVAPLLGWQLVEIPDWNCCGASAAHSLNHELALALPARVLALAERAGLDEVLVPCSACFTRLAAAQRAISQDAATARRVGELIELECTGKTRVLSVLELLARSASDGLASRVRQPFSYKVACYYGCFLTRPAELAVCRRHEDPQEMEELLRAIGAEPIRWAFKVECCGAGLSVARVDSVAELSGRIVEDAVRRGAEAIIVACPMCHTNLDLRRDAICRRRNAGFSIPVLYVTQAVGLALGLGPRELGLHRHNVPVRLPPREKKEPGPVRES